MTYPKRLIEVDLPIARISAHARREKSIRHGHISTLHMWWARRPLAACRAVICAALWPDPADEQCPQAFRDAAAQRIVEFARRADGDMKLLATSSEEGKARWAALVKSPISVVPSDAAELLMLRVALLDFVADFANWDNSTNIPYLETSRALTQAAHEALGGEPGTRPLVVDPFAGGGSIPLESLRVGADAFASDLNPVAVLLNKVMLEYIPKYGRRLADEVRKWGKWVKEQAEKDLKEFYPKDPDGATPVAYLWARTIQCEGPGCGAEVPLLRSLWLVRKGGRSVALRLVPHPRAKRVDFEIIHSAKATDVGNGTAARGSATCPCCGYTTSVASVRVQLRSRRGGSADARLFAVVTTPPGAQGRSYRLATASDLKAVEQATSELTRRRQARCSSLPIVPDEPLPPQGTLGFRVQLYGMEQWGDLFNSRQLLALTTLSRFTEKVGQKSTGDENHSELNDAVQACLSLAIGRLTDRCSALCTWDPSPAASGILHVFCRQAIAMVWDYAEGTPLEDKSGGWLSTLEWIVRVLEKEAQKDGATVGHVEQGSATCHSLPDDFANAFISDPPYYDAVPYSDLSDFFYVWLKRSLPDALQSAFSTTVSPKEQECIVDEAKGQNRDYFENAMKQALREGRRVLAPSGIGVVVFAHKSTAGWETMLQALIDAGWIITGSWPIDTELGNRLRAMGSAALASSVHLICRPRETFDGVLSDDMGEWRDTLSELPIRIHEWMPRLAHEGVVGADAIFACLGPALEIFSRYSRVEKASGEAATLREYLEHVWAAVSTEALSMIFEDADAAGLEPDARLTAMWLWTLGGGSGKAGTNGTGHNAEGDEESEDTDDENTEEGEGKASKIAGYVLEFDAARKIAQGLGIHLEKNETTVEIKGDKARLRPVSERTQYLFGKDTEAAPTGRGKNKAKVKQKSFFEELDEAEAAEAGWGELKGPPPGSTVLDRLHQSMILFAAGRGELLKRFLTEEGIGTDARFWKLAQSFSALYPRGSDEKRWVDGVLARKKGLGF